MTCEWFQKQFTQIGSDCVWWSLLLTSDWSSPLIVWLVCPQIWDMTQVVGSSVAAGFSPRWLAVFEGPAHTPPTNVCQGSRKRSPTRLTLSSFSCGVYAKRTVQQGVCEYMCVCVIGMVLDLWFGGVHVSYEVWLLGFEWTWTQGTSKSTILALFLFVSLYPKKKREAFSSSIILFIYPSVLFIFLSLFEFECHCWP